MSARDRMTTPPRTELDRRLSALVLICHVGTCVRPAQPEHSPCCSSTMHGKSFCCEHYCRSHFVEAHPCTPESHAAVAAVGGAS